MMQITEDTPPDMLAGAMDLTIHLPDGKASKMSVERSTPMMDVLVQITNSNQLQISGYTLQPLAMNSTPGFGEKILPFMPNTPIGTLDTQDIRVVAKHRGSATLQRSTTQQPFESTFRLKVHLPRNQLWVERVSMNAYLRDIMRKLCDEKNLDSGKYEFRHPGNLDQVLDLKLRLADYQITEIYAVSKGSNRLTQVFSSSDSIMAFRKDDERKQKSNSGGGLFNFLKRGGKISSGSGSLSSDNRSISPTHSDDSRSLSPPLSNAPVKLSSGGVDKPKPPLRKRRPAPKPPAAIADVNGEDATLKDEMKKKDGLTICHSRNSSDSSGYHEASILSDNANTSLPRKRTPSNSNQADSAVSMSSSSNLQAMKHQSKSTSSLAFPSRKKKAPPPPSVIKSASSVAHLENASPVVASPTEASDAVRDEVKRPSVKVDEKEEKTTTNLPPETSANDTVTEQSSNKETDLGDFNTNSSSSDKEIISNNEEVLLNEEKKVIAEEENIQRSIENTVNVSAITTLDKVITKSDEHVDGVAYVQCDEESVEVIENTEWEYQLPSPPTAFRDSSPQPTSVSTESETVSDIHPSTDSILTSPELFEKLNVIKESQSEIQSTNSVESEEVKFISKLSLENLEKRKKLVYNRELATSLKYKDDQEAEDITSKRFNVLNELEDVLANPPSRNSETNKNWNNIARSENFTAQNERKLPNFKITTYDVPKKKINIFEDDSIRSNVNAPPAEEENVVLRRPQQEFNKHRCMTLNRELLHRSESFSTWTPTVPVKRSKSQAFVKPIVQKREGIWAAADCNSSANTNNNNSSNSNEEKSRSTLDLTGLQSLEVMKAIRTTLTTTPSTSITTITHTDEVRKQPKQMNVYETPSISLTSWQERKSSIEKITTVNNNNNVTIKINGSESTAPTPAPPQQHQPTNVVIKVNSIKEDSTKRFINRTTAVGYRKPLGNINKVERPHSIAIDQCDASRVPVVRAVELKKTFKQNNASPFSHLGTSITQIRPDDRAADKNNLFDKVILRNVSVKRASERPKSLSTIQSVDTRGQLLDAIRNFGGKKGLKTVRT